MKNLFLILAMVVGGFAAAATPVSQVPTSRTEFELNRWLGPAAFKNTLGTKLMQAHNTAVGVYDFSATGGAVGDHLVGITLPDNAIIRHVFFDILTQPTSGGAATVAFKSAGAADLLAATAIASLTVGQLAGVPDGTVAEMVKMSAETSVYATIATAALTAGKIKVYVDYVLSE